MKKYFLFVTTLLISHVYADTWVWETSISRIRSFNGTSMICFSADGVDRPYICFDTNLPGGAERLSMLLAAKMANASVDVSYSEPNNGESMLWLDNTEFYWSHHFYVR